MTEQELHGVLEEQLWDNVPKHTWKEEGDEEEIQAIKSMMEGNIAIA